jgi:DNA-binding response OmpR family regulator
VEGLREAIDWVSDVKLPEMDGFEVCRRLKADAAVADIPVVHLSAMHRDDASLMGGLESGGDG